MIEKTQYIWMDGELVPWDQARVHVLTHTLHYGFGVFEGIRYYRTRDGRSAVFRLEDHVQRLFHSARILGIEIPYQPGQIVEASLALIRSNRLDAGYLRPLVFIGEGAMGVYAPGNPVRTALVTWPWGTYLGEEALKQGIRAKVSSYARHYVNSNMPRAKAVGNYINSVLAKQEVKRLGYDEAILLDTGGLVSEGSGENIFIVQKGVLITPPLKSVLAGITRDSVMELARDGGVEVREGEITRDALYIADEVFFTGTAAEVTPVREIDSRPIGGGRPGPITVRLQEAFFDAVNGRKPQFQSWLTFVQSEAVA